jgi:hypothetical protein
LDWIKSENHKIVKGFQEAGETIVTIDKDYEKTISNIE